MKKLLVILLLLATFINETEAKIQAGVGITAGPSFGRWNNGFKNSKLSTAGGTLRYEIGAHAGIQGRIWFNKFVGLNLAAEFNMSGSKFEKIQNVNSFSEEHSEYQITVPVTAMVGWGNERLRIFGNFGGYFGYNISGKDKEIYTLSGIVQPNAGKVKSDYKNNYNPLDAGVRLGAGIQVYVDKKLKSCVTFDINYDYGFIKTFKNGAPAYFNNPDKLKITPSKLLIGVGYIYTFGKSQSEDKPNRISDMSMD